MAIALEFANVIIPISVINRIYPGGFNSFIQSQEEYIGSQVWHDDHLFRDGAMDGEGIANIINQWMVYGLQPFRIDSGLKYWNDCCVIDEFYGTELPCEWLLISDNRLSCYLKGTEPQNIVGRTKIDEDDLVLIETNE